MDGDGLTDLPSRNVYSDQYGKPLTRVESATAEGPMT